MNPAVSKAVSNLKNALNSNHPPDPAVQEAVDQLDAALEGADENPPVSEDSKADPVIPIVTNDNPEQLSTGEATTE